MDEAVLFRAAKRRKLPRRASSSDQAQTPDTTNHTGVKESMEDREDDAVDPITSPVSNLIKSRKLVRGRRIGMTFSNARPATPSEEAEPAEDTGTYSAIENINAMSDRFVGHTGQVADADKHMMEYIDSEMAKRRLLNLQSTLRSKASEESFSTSESDQSYSEEEEEDDDDDDDHADVELAKAMVPDQAHEASRITTRNPASIGKLQEVDLGPAARQRAAQLTSAALARQKLRASQSGAAEDEDPRPRRRRRIRLTRDGRIIKPRPRKRRPSADIARDALVEQILNENRVDLYTSGHEPAVPSAPQTHPARQRPQTGDTVDHPGQAEEEEDNDERLAAQFRQDFIESMAIRHAHRHGHKAKPSAAGDKTGEKTSRGPKLGGSRSARAAMAARQREEREKKKKQQQQQQQESGK